MLHSTREFESSSVLSTVLNHISISDSPAHVAIAKRNVDGLALLLKHGADINVRDGVNETPLHRSVVVGYLDATRMLLNHGARTELRDNNYFTPLMAAVVHRRLEHVS